MAGRLQREIRQSRDFERPEEEAVLNIARTADAFDQSLSELLKKFDLSATQYNVLRILRGAGREGLPCGEIGARMIARDPDITRLVDRLEKRTLVERNRSQTDRRVVATRITAQGLAVLDRLDEPLARLLGQLLGHMSRRKLDTLIDLLEEAREKAQQASADHRAGPAPNSAMKSHAAKSKRIGATPR